MKIVYSVSKIRELVFRGQKQSGPLALATFQPEGLFLTYYMAPSFAAQYTAFGNFIFSLMCLFLFYSSFSDLLEYSESAESRPELQRLRVDIELSEASHFVFTSSQIEIAKSILKFKTPSESLGVKTNLRYVARFEEDFEVSEATFAELLKASGVYSAEQSIFFIYYHYY